MNFRSSRPAHTRSFALWILHVCLLAAAFSGAAFAANPTLPPWSPAHKDAAFTAFFRQTNRWAAGDVATSIPLSDGRVLWLFGDSYIDQFDPATGTLPCLFDAHNAVLVQHTNDLMHPRTLNHSQSGDKSLFRPPVDGRQKLRTWFWPGAGFQSGNTVYVYLTELQQTPGGGMWGFTNIGQYWARLSFPKLRVGGYDKLPPLNGICFWCGFVPDDKTGFTYAYGARQRFTAADVFVARFPTATPAERWSFWDGKGWNPDVKQAAVIAQGASTSVNVCRIKHKFLLTTTQFSVACDQGRDIYVATSDRPTGPFSARRKIFTVDDTVQGHHPFFYAAAAHPEFINAAGELLITYCINGYAPCVPTCVKGRMNPDYYRPRGIRLPLWW